MVMTFLGEMLYQLLPFPVPASIYGLILMLLALSTKVVKLEQVKVAADFLIEIMPPMFIPAAVGLLVVWPELKKVLLPVLVITVVSTVLVMGITGRIAQNVMVWKRRKEEKRG